MTASAAMPETPLTSVSPSDAALGFDSGIGPPPLSPEIAEFVAPPIIASYQEAAQDAGIAVGGPMPESKPPIMVASKGRKSKAAAMGEGGPEQMSGAVVANLDALNAPATPEGPSPSVYANAAGVAPAAVVFFPGDSVYLSASSRAQVRAAAQQYLASGGAGYVRVVGHSSSRTPNMPVARHIEVLFKKSQERADAVAKELIHDGVPADKVLVSGVGDSEPVYYESMPKGEDGNRRAEIFFQS